MIHLHPSSTRRLLHQHWVDLRHSPFRPLQQHCRELPLNPAGRPSSSRLVIPGLQRSGTLSFSPPNLPDSPDFPAFSPGAGPSRVQDRRQGPPFLSPTSDSPHSLELHLQIFRHLTLIIIKNEPYLRIEYNKVFFTKLTTSMSL